MAVFAYVENYPQTPFSPHGDVYYVLHKGFGSADIKQREVFSERGRYDARRAELARTGVNIVTTRLPFFTREQFSVNYREYGMKVDAIRVPISVADTVK